MQLKVITVTILATKQMNKDQEKRLEETDVVLREKYLQIVQLLTQNELNKRITSLKANYKRSVICDMEKLLPDIDRKVIDDRAQYISNILNNEAKCLRGQKSKLHRNSNSKETKLVKSV